MSKTRKVGTALDGVVYYIQMVDYNIDGFNTQFKRPFSVLIQKYKGSNLILFQIISCNMVLNEQNWSNHFPIEIHTTLFQSKH